MATRTRGQSAGRPEPAGRFPGALILGSALGVAVLLVAAAVLGRTPSPITWYVARASGIMLYLMLWGSTLTGLGLTTALLDRCGGRGMVFSIHAFITQMAYGFLVLHLLSLAADPIVDFGPRQLLAPFASGWREPWTGLGVLAGGLTIVIGGSFAAKRLIGQRAWRALHWLTFPLYGMALLHGVGAGTDTHTPWASVLYLITGATVVLFSLYRLLRFGSRARTGSAERQRRANQHTGRAEPPQAGTVGTAHAHPGH
jgi:hypothetical protein